MPGAGLEPAWGFPHKILSLARLPISPPRHRSAIQITPMSKDDIDLRPHRMGLVSKAGNGTRTRDPNLGKVVLYQLSYSRKGEILTGMIARGKPVVFSVQRRRRPHATGDRKHFARPRPTRSPKRLSSHGLAGWCVIDGLEHTTCGVLALPNARGRPIGST